jgi:hypothetical protein
MLYGDPNRLDLDLTPYDRLRVDFDGLDQILNFNVAIFTDEGKSQLGCNLATIQAPFSVDLLLSDFVPPRDFSHVRYIDFIFQAGNPLLSQDFGVTKISALRLGGVRLRPVVICNG